STGGVRRRDARAGPAERLGERRAGDVTRVAVADGVGTGDELHVAVVDAGVSERRTGRNDAVLDEVAAPLAPRVHAHPGDNDIGVHAPAPIGRHFQTTCSPSAS